MSKKEYRYKDTNRTIEIGDMITIVELDGELNERYRGRFGTVKDIDDAGQIHGVTSIAIIPEVDSFLVIKPTMECFAVLHGKIVD